MIDEGFVQDSFCRWLLANDWIVIPGCMTRGADITAMHNKSHEELIVECKGDNGRKAGVDLDIAYGQLLRRMDAGRAYDGSIDRPDKRYCLVVPRTGRCVYAALRVSDRIRRLLRISIYSVAEDGSVASESDGFTLAPT